MVIGISMTLTKEDAVRKLRTLHGENAPYVIQCVPGKIVLRCDPSEIEDVCSRIKGMDGTSESLLVSGTLKTLREKYPDLKTHKDK